MSISIFLSFPKPHLQSQATFIEALCTYLRGRGFEPRTLGVNEYDMDAPLTAIRRLMLESNGLITVALRRTWIQDGMSRRSADIPGVKESTIADQWLSSAYCQIEPAMAYQLGLPILIIREAGVVADGLLDRGAVGLHMPEFSLDGDPLAYLKTPEWGAIIGKWEGYVRAVVDAKGRPPRLFSSGS
jgi:hypothetical protein